MNYFKHEHHQRSREWCREVLLLPLLVKSFLTVGEALKSCQRAEKKWLRSLCALSPTCCLQSRSHLLILKVSGFVLVMYQEDVLGTDYTQHEKLHTLWHNDISHTEILLWQVKGLCCRISFYWPHTHILLRFFSISSFCKKKNVVLTYFCNAKFEFAWGVFVNFLNNIMFISKRHRKDTMW